jgi:hypothetical protein
MDWDNHLEEVVNQVHSTVEALNVSAETGRVFAQRTRATAR